MSNPNIDPRDLRFPAVAAGMTIGLFGGSFNPPHQGHALVAETAIKRLGLDQIWWMVTPGNPLKSTRELLPLGQRIALSRAIAASPRIKVTAFELGFRTRYSADTIAHILARHKTANFVWVMGADNLRTFHHWQHWQKIAEMLPIVVVDRPGSTLSYISSKMALTYDYARVDEDDAALLPYLKAPAWTFIHGPRSSLSSTALRAGNKLS